MKQEDFITAYQHVMSLTNVKPYKRPRKNYQVTNFFLNTEVACSGFF